MTAPKNFLTDWRGPGRFTEKDRAREADYVSCWQTWTEQPIPGVPTLPVFSLTVYEGALTTRAFTEPWGVGAFERDFFMEDASGYWRIVWQREDGTARTIALDPTRRGFIGWIAPQIVERFKWAQGIHVDYFTDMAWLFPDIHLDYWVKYRAAMENLCAELRRLRPDWIILGQNYHFPKDTGGHLDGLYLEQTPTSFGMTLKDHAANIEAHRALLKIAHRGPGLWVAEIREPARIKAMGSVGETYLLNVMAWCDAMGVAVSWGRDGTAGVGFPG